MDAVEVSDEKLLNKQSNEEINEFENNEKEPTTDLEDEKIDQEGPLIRSKRSTDETEINLNSETENFKNIIGETPSESLTEGGDKTLKEETTEEKTNTPGK